MRKKRKRRAPRGRKTLDRTKPASATPAGLPVKLLQRFMEERHAKWALEAENWALRAKNDSLQAAVIEATTRRRNRKPADAPAPSGRPRGRPRVLPDAVVRELLRQTSGRKLSVRRLVDRLKHQGIIVDRTTLQKALKKARAQS